MDQRFKTILPLFIFFSAATLVICGGLLFFEHTSVDFRVLVAANCLFFLLSLTAFRLQYNAMHHSNPNVFIRRVMGTMALKMFVCIAAVMAYVLICGKDFNKPSVYISLLIYLVYLVLEVALVMKLNKRKNA